MRIELPIIQIAGVADSAEAAMIVRAGASHIGFPLRLPVHQPDTSESEAKQIISTLPREIEPVLISYLERAEEIAGFCDYLGCRTVQLHGSISVEQLQSLHGSWPELIIFKSLVVGEHPGGVAELEKLCRTFAPYVDAFITDTFDPATGASGATGRTHDWAVSRRLVQISPRPVILAGGLNPENVVAGIAATGAAGVDSHTGVEDSNGRKSAALLNAFVTGTLQAYAGPCL